MIRTLLLILLFSTTILAVDYTEYNLNKQAKKSFEKENYEEAINTLNDLIQKDPSNHKYYHNLGQAHLNSKNAEEAENYFSQALDLNQEGSNRDTKLNLSAAYLMQQKIDKAKTILKELIIENPNDLEAKHNYELATILEQMQQEQDSESNNNEENQENEESTDNNNQEQEEEQEQEQEQEEQEEQEQEQEQEEESELEKQLREALEKEEEEKQKRIDHAKNILETLSQREEEARKKHA